MTYLSPTIMTIIVYKKREFFYLTIIVYNKGEFFYIPLFSIVNFFFQRPTLFTHSYWVDKYDYELTAQYNSRKT